MVIPGENRELPLPPGVHAYMQDLTKGAIKTYVGPVVINQTGQEKPVVYSARSRMFNEASSLEGAVQPNAFAKEGDYIVLEGPAAENRHPNEADVNLPRELQHGTSINIPGPASFALWPGQGARVIPGHHLRSNQYLVVRIYNEEEARKNWRQAVVKTAVEGDEEGVVAKEADELNLTMGKLLVIKGTEVSFYIPPTGVEVDPDEEGSFVREAVTLERLEYCLLIDEDGNKRYPKGPDVVFPEPTETFSTEGRKRKFKAEELNEIQGLHIKVIEAYTDGEKQHKEGDELFITGKDCAIYFPQREHAIIEYSGKRKHFATAVPKGEGRYVMDRRTGEIKTVKGPIQLLPDPRYEVIVRRVLSDREVQDWYPDSPDALAYNRSLRKVSDENEFVESASLEDYEATDDDSMGLVAKDTFSRRTTYTKPRTVTLDTKYDGVPTINVWNGYAVMVVDKSGNRRTAIGPETILLEYDETLEVMELSMGKPKTTDRLQRTIYLRTKNNKVSDIIDVDTRDHVPVQIKLSFLVDFKNETDKKWFDCDNYVKYLCDHVRSMLKGAISRMEIEEFYENRTAIVRDVILGVKAEDGSRPGLKFEDENGMAVKDVEVLAARIMDDEVSELLEESQRDAVRRNVDLRAAEKDLQVSIKREGISQQKAMHEDETDKIKSELAIAKVKRTCDLELSRTTAEIDKTLEQKKEVEAQIVNKNLVHENELARKKADADQVIAVQKAEIDLQLRKLKENTAAAVARFEVCQSGFSEALLAIQNQDTLTKVAQAASVQTWIGGKSVVEVIKNIFEDTHMEDVLKKVSGRLVPSNSDDPSIPSSR